MMITIYLIKKHILLNPYDFIILVIKTYRFAQLMSRPFPI